MWIIQRPAGLKMYKYKTSPAPILKAKQELPKSASPKGCSGQGTKELWRNGYIGSFPLRLQPKI
jgi:hypothetical protein